MKKLLLTIGFGLLILQCAPPEKVAIPPKEEKPITVSIPCSPGGLTAKPGDHSLFLRWNTNCTESALLSGYNVYLLKEPLDKKYYYEPPDDHIKPYNGTPYPGDTSLEKGIETIIINNLENGREFYVTVRAVLPDGKLSAASNELAVICRPEGEFRLAYRYAGKNDGFSFAKGKATRADAGDNDICFYQQDGFDFVASPHRTNGFLRKSAFYSLGKTGDIYQYPKFDLNIPPTDNLPVLTGESYLIKTSDGNYAKFRIESATGRDKKRSLEIKYIFQPTRGLIRF